MKDIIDLDNIQLSIEQNGNYKLILKENLMTPIIIEACNKKEVIRLLSKKFKEKEIYNPLLRKKIIKIIQNKFSYLKVLLIEY